MYRVHVANQWIHDKNRAGFEMIMAYAQSIGDWVPVQDPQQADIVWAPSKPEAFPNAKRILYGPHFSILPEGNYLSLSKSDSRLLYIQPSQWVVQLWRDQGANGIPIYPAPFPVDLEQFKSISLPRTKVFVYLKNRSPHEYDQVIQLLRNHGYDPVIINYSTGYNQQEYIHLLNEAIFGIWVGRVESQGFALEEALAMNVPLLVWSVVRMDQTYGLEQNYSHIHTKVDTAPYWDERCGVLIREASQLETGLQDLVKGIHEIRFKPREYIEEHLSPKAVYERYWKPLCQIDIKA
jgi:hypothetical protein